jgi:lipoprotein-anchoring transpeptidase ErfK/SrfK
MRLRSLLIFSSVLVIIIGIAAGALYSYDAMQADRIAPGVTINGIDVGGLEAGAARVVIRRRVIDPLEQPLVIRHDDARFELTARRAKLGVDAEQSVQAALAASRRGNPLSRTWRKLNGGRVETNVVASVSYSSKAVSRLVERVGDELGRPAVDAQLDIDAGGVHARPARAGRRIDAERLERQIHRRLVDFDGRRTVKVRTARVEPEVGDDDLVERYPAVVVVNRKDFTLTLYKDLKRDKRYDIAVGKVGMDTPRGLYQIQNKAVDPDWYVPDSEWAGDLAGEVIKGDDPDNPIKSRWLGIYDGVGIHGTDDTSSIGSAASHGCIRMRIPEVKELYEQVPVASPVYIA